jgi:hypothetical protein
LDCRGSLLQPGPHLVKAAARSEYGSPERGSDLDVDTPAPKDHEALVWVHATTVIEPTAASVRRSHRSCDCSSYSGSHSGTPSAAALNNSLIAGMLLIEGSRFTRLGLPSEVKMLMTVGCSLSGIESTREVASPPTRRAVRDPHLWRLGEVLDENGVLLHRIYGTSS